MIIDTVPKLLESVVSVNVLEAMMITALEKSPDKVTDDDLSEIVGKQGTEPRMIYSSGRPGRVSRFAFVIHPLSQEHLKKDKTVEILSGLTPPVFLDVAEKIVSYAPPWIYSKVTGIKSPTGAEAEGWLIILGGTSEQMLSRSPEFTDKRLVQAAKLAKRLGAQIVGLGTFTRAVGDAGVTAANLADIPVTTGYSYTISGTLWAVADAVRRMGLIRGEKGKRLNARAMVIGASGTVGSVCCRLLSHAFEDVRMTGQDMAKLLALKASVLEETPDVRLSVSTQSDKYLPDMDVIIIAASEAGEALPDIMRVKSGCVIADMASSPVLFPEDVKKRPDVLVIESGEIELPGNPEMKNIGLPPKVAYPSLAETIVLALEGRFENFTTGRDIEWQKVREIYKTGLRHGMKLAAISGVNGVLTDEDIAKVRSLALEDRKRNSVRVKKQN